MKILALDAASDACSAALYLAGEYRVRYELAPRRHGEILLPMVEALLAQAGLGLGDLHGIAFGRGPGAFTGIRIAAGVTQGLAFGADLPVVPISSLQALAQGAFRAQGDRQGRRDDMGGVLAAFDARMGEVYWGVYHGEQAHGRVSPLVDECVCTPEDVPLPQEDLARFGHPWLAVGGGWGSYGPQLSKSCGVGIARMEPDSYPHARDVAHLAVPFFERGETLSAEMAQPVYLRDRVAAVPRGR